jgi:chemotaxis protein CheD
MTGGEEINKHFLFPGTLFADPKEFQISTVLGSCEALCLWDSVARIGGMNNYMLPLWNGEGLATPKYGNIAIEKLLLKLLSLGCRKENLVAKVFGGANVTSSGNEIFMIGDRNILLVNEMLEEYRIVIKSSDVGGHVGRKVIMNSATGVVMVGKGKSSIAIRGSVDPRNY